MAEIYKCPKCGTEWERSKHYEAIVHNLSMINILTGNPTIVTDYCGKCNHREEKED
jgi:predicted nucleic-acid-binding Zn-ribbon protein